MCSTKIEGQLNTRFFECGLLVHVLPPVMVCCVFLSQPRGKTGRLGRGKATAGRPIQFGADRAKASGKQTIQNFRHKILCELEKIKVPRPQSTPRRPGKPGQNRDSRDGVFGHPESQVGPLPRGGLYARVSTPHQHTIGMQLRQLREFLEGRRWQEVVLVVEEVVSGSRRGGPERDRLLDATRRREIDIIPSGTYRFRDQRARLE